VIRWVVERTITWYHGMRRLRIRWERRDDIHKAFLGLATCIICYRTSRSFVRTLRNVSQPGVGPVAPIVDHGVVLA
jgi:hypothetical protein